MARKSEKSSGDRITVGDITGSSGVAIGREAQAHVTTGIPAADLNQLFSSLVEASKTAPAEKRAEAIQTVEALKTEVTKGNNVDDSRVANLVDRLVDLAPGAISAVTSVFASPALAGITGPVTKFVLEKLKKG